MAASFGTGSGVLKSWQTATKCIFLVLVLATTAVALPLEKRLEHRAEEQNTRRALLQATTMDGTAPIGIAAPASGFCNSGMYPTICTVPGTATTYCCPSGYSCFPGTGYTCYKQSPDGSFPSQPSNFNCDDVIEITIDEIQDAFAAGTLTSRALVECYLQRIADLDSISTFKGQVAYATNAVLEIDPNVIALAEEKDKERAACMPNCSFSKLHGIPIGLKDNIASDGLNCTAGSWNLLGSIHKEAFIVTKLRDAGGIMMAKMGLSEWAFFKSSGGISGWNGRGGQTYSPYVRYQPINVSTFDLPYYPEIPSAVPVNQTFTNTYSPGIISGSSGASAVGAATNIIAVTVGSETGGSVLSPAGVNGVVGFRPTNGVMSRNGIVPISSTQDTAGPICRTVADCLYMFDAMAYDDLADPVHSGSTPWLPQYTRPEGGYLPFLDPNGLAGKKIAVFRSPNPDGSDVYPLIPINGPVVDNYAKLPDMLRSRGAIVDVLPDTFDFLNLDGSVFYQDFKVDMNIYLSQLTWKEGYTPLYSLADLIAYDKQYFDLEFQGGTCCRGDPAFAQFYDDLFVASEETGDKRDPFYVSSKMNSSMIAASITDWFTSNGYDAVAAASNLIGTFARIGFPGISLPCPLQTTTSGTPQGLTFHSYPYKEGDLFAISYDVEQNLCGAQTRPLPTYCDGISC
ncbi:hypothetical protein KFL_002530070 [Klebsormidium nitens]|uniref:Amidase domain-containing protein n=1 Tax=Klebsormidium nitens TaxID=105231 RepID=A0A1Y1I755_KLENI|nr:hypothetical protein KFL_002530070 [Klebsormidium nitens]|eukprot:GAQ85762.1 hypothetical protein KFL_002530070 [Klebsormidium nitens]